MTDKKVSFTVFFDNTTQKWCSKAYRSDPTGSGLGEYVAIVYGLRPDTAFKKAYSEAEMKASEPVRAITYRSALYTGNGECNGCKAKAAVTDADLKIGTKMVVRLCVECQAFLKELF